MLQSIFSLGVSGIIGLFAIAPSSTNFNLKAFELGTGGSDNLSSTNYNINGLTGQQAGITMSSTSYIVGSGQIPTQNANITAPPTVTNPANYYNRLNVVLDTGDNPPDTTYLIAVSDDNFVTTFYVQTDNSIGPALSIANYQTYSAWGGASGFTLLGLSPSKTYQLKVKALQGDFTETAYSSEATAATVATSLSFSVATSITPTPPFSASFTSLAPNTVVDANATADLSFSTNAVNGGTIYVTSTNAGLVSSLAGSTISSSSADLSVVSSGYGAVVSSTSQVSGGPIVSQSPYNGSGNNVGGLSNSLIAILDSSSAITTGAGSVTLKARSNATTPSSTDYSDTITFIVAASF
jgi:hypothetical protein